jgi:phosphatidate phosphatase APP1
MNTTYPEKNQDSLPSFSPAMGALALHSLDRPEWLSSAEECERRPVDFAYCWEEEFARMLSEHQIAWQYKPRTFAVEWDEEGNFVDSFTPDFYLPAFGMYIELVASDRRASGEKARKVRLLRQHYTEIRIQLLSAPSSSSILEMVS